MLFVRLSIRAAFVDHTADQTERKTVLGADVAEDHLAQMQSNTERKVLPNIGIGVLLASTGADEPR